MALVLSPITTSFAGERIFALGDIHGDYEAFTKALRHADLIDQDANWSGGDAVLVQTGDFLDRGADIKAVMDLLIRLQDQADAAGGRVWVLIGNHEAMNLAGFFRDVNPAAYADFAKADSEKRRTEAYKAHVKFSRRLAAKHKMPPPILDKAYKKRWMKKNQPGFIEYREALGPNGTYGMWLRQLPGAARIGNTVFMHAGLNPEHEVRSVDHVNRRLLEDIMRMDEGRAYLVEKGLALPFWDVRTIMDSVNEAVYAATNQKSKRFETSKDKQRLSKLSEFLKFQGGILLDGQGPLWFRGFADWSDDEARAALETLAKTENAQHFVCGHTPQVGGIRTRLDGRIFLIDCEVRMANGENRMAMLELNRNGFHELGIEETVFLAELSQGPMDKAQGTGPGAVHAMVKLKKPKLPAEGEAEPWPAPQHTWRNKQGDILPFKTDADLIAFMRDAPIVSHRELGSGSTRPWRVVLEKDGIRMRAIFRYADSLSTQKGRRGLGRGVRDSYLFEPAAYAFDQLLGMGRVPPAVLREYKGKSGSLQVWMEGTMTEDKRREDKIKFPNRPYWFYQDQVMRIFDAIIFNYDRNQGNILYDEQWRTWFIDHTRSFRLLVRPPELGKIFHCERRLWQRLTSLSDAAIKKALEPHLDQSLIRPVLKRRLEVVAHLQAQIAKEGKEKVLFDWSDLPNQVIQMPPRQIRTVR